jgi:hypothetical protein
MEYVTKFIEFASEHWKEILAVATTVAALSAALVAKWKSIKK